MSNINTKPEHVCVAVCTYRRPELLKRLLRGIEYQDADETYTYSVLVIDNDGSQSARGTVSAFCASSGLHVEYRVEPRQSIAAARNTAVQHADGDYVVFIDDDELPIRGWLGLLVAACRKYHADGVLGPVKPEFDGEPPGWLLRGRFHERPTYETGLVIDWRKGRTGNTLLRKHVFDGVERPFDPAYVTGEDQDFFLRMIRRGYVFVWCNEAEAYEIVPPTRWKRSFLLRRALLRGEASAKYPSRGISDTLKSLFAIFVYTLFLPFSLLLGQHRFMDLLVRLFAHLGKVLATIGVTAVGDRYVSG